MRRPFCLLLVLLTLTSVVAAASSEPVGAAPPSTLPAGANPSDQAKSADLQKRREQIDGQLDLLQANDVDLQTELDRLAALLVQQQDALERAKADLAKVTKQLDGLQGAVDQARQDADAARRRAQVRAVNAYMHPGIDDVSALLEAEDYDQAHRRRTMLGEVAKYDADVLQGSIDAQKHLEDRQAQLADAQQQADRLKQSAQDSLDDIGEARQRQVLAKQQLDQRIAGFREEAGALAAQQSELTRIINERATPAPSANAGGSGDETAAPPPTTPAPATTARSAPSSPSKAPAAQAPPTQAPTTNAPVTTSPPRKAGVRLSWPLSGPITSPFGSRWGTHHDGIDIGVNTGTPIHAAAAGTIIYCGQISGYGNVDMVDHHNGMVTLYAHQSQLACSMGQSVSAGQVIGYSGNTGHSTGPHLHFEVRVNAVAVDPMQYLP